MSNNLTIQQTYHDVLFFASSTPNKKLSWYLEPSEFKVLLKMAHYASTYEEITFQNKDIAKHTFLSEYTVKNAIEALYRKGYLRSEKDLFSNRGGYKSKRTIFINWTFLEEIFNLIGTEIETPLVTMSFAQEETVISETIDLTPSQSQMEEEPIISSPSINNDELMDFLKNNSSGLKHLKIVMLESDIANGTITTIEELKEEII